MKRYATPTVAGASAGLLLAAFALAAYAADKKVEPPKPALTVTTVLPSQASLPIKLAANGNIVAWQEAIVGSEVNGLRLTEVRVNVGDNVRAGQVLAVFSDETVRADVAQARAALMEAEANASDAAGNASRARTLQSTGALSTQQINQYNTVEQTARARVEAARAALAVQQTRLKQTRLVAPDSGVISARTATVGSVVGAGTELFRLIRKGRLEWRAEVTASELGRIRSGATATIQAANGSQLTGKVRMVAPTVDPQTRSALVYVDLPAAMQGSAPAKAGMFAKGEFELGNSGAMTVPQQSVVVRDGYNYVFRLNPDSRVGQLKVQTGRRLGDRIEVTGGLPANTEVVVSGAGFLNDGDLVRKVGAQPAPAPAAAPAAAPARK
ncbi:MAG TPA: efflux RND transporter periplasmic adaptor subunit [Burkholderiaceae bacterium]